MKISNNVYVRGAGLFLLGAMASELYRRFSPRSPSVAQAASVLLADILSRGWKPVTYEAKSGAQIDVSLFAIGLVAATAYVVVERGDEHWVLLNVEKRNDVDVADVPCGFINSGEPGRLARTMKLLGQEGKLHVPPPIDGTTKQAMLRELLEETGLTLPEDASSKLILLNNVEQGRRFYPRYLNTFSVATSEDLPALTPEGGGIRKSQWINVARISFRCGDDGLAKSGAVVIDGITYQLKPADDTAKDLYYAIGLATDGRFGSEQHPGEALQDPGVVPEVVGGQTPG